MILKWVENRLRDGDPEPPPQKQFKAKFNLPVLKSYRGATDDSYWRYWPKVSGMTQEILEVRLNLISYGKWPWIQGFKTKPF